MNDAFRSMQFRNFRLWFVGQGTSQVGFWVQIIGQNLLVLELTDSGTLLGLLAAMQYLPMLALGPWAGVVSDRLPKRTVLLWTQSTMMLSALALGVLALAGEASLGAVYVLAAIGGIAYAFDQPVRRTIVTELVDEPYISNAVTLNTSLGNLAKIIGPAIAALLATTVGLGWCFIVNGASSLAVIVGLSRMDESAMRSPDPIRRQRGQVREGFAYVGGDPQLRSIVLMLGTLAIFSFNYNVLLPLLVTRDLRAGAGAYGLLAGVMSVGGLGSTLTLARRGSAPPDLLATASLLFGGSLLLLALAPTLLVAGVAAVGAGWFSMTLFNSGAVSLQLGSVPSLRGRVMALYSMIFVGSNAIGGPVVGWAAERSSARIGFAIGAGVALLAGVVAHYRIRARHRQASSDEGGLTPVAFDVP